MSRCSRAVTARSSRRTCRSTTSPAGCSPARRGCARHLVLGAAGCGRPRSAGAVGPPRAARGGPVGLLSTADLLGSPSSSRCCRRRTGRRPGRSRPARVRPALSGCAAWRRGPRDPRVQREAHQPGARPQDPREYPQLDVFALVGPRADRGLHRGGRRRRAALRAARPLRGDAAGGVLVARCRSTRRSCCSAARSVGHLPVYGVFLALLAHGSDPRPQAGAWLPSPRELRAAFMPFSLLHDGAGGALSPRAPGGQAGTNLAQWGRAGGQRSARRESRQPTPGSPCRR